MKRLFALTVAFVFASALVVNAQSETERITEGKIDVGGRSLAFHCRGSGSPTVVIETGMGDPGISWSPLLPRIAELSRVCLYARAGLGDSDPPGDEPAHVDSTVGDLAALLEKAAISPPYLLIGHSLGGLHARRFAERFPGLSAGLLLLDPSHEEMGEISRAYATPEVEAFREAFETFRKSQPTTERMKDFQDYAAGLEPALLGDLPLIVLTSTREPPQMQEQSLPEELHEPFRVAYDDLEISRRAVLVILRHLHRDIARLSTQGRQRNVEDAGHFIHTDQPEVVLDALRELLREIRGR